MSPSFSSSSPLVVVTGANGFVGARVCAALVDRGAVVRALVRRKGHAPDLPGVEEHVSDFAKVDEATAVLDGASAVVTTVHPMGSGRDVQHRVGVDGTTTFARAAAATGVKRLVHVSTAGVYDRSPEMGDVDESSPLVGDAAGAYAVTKRDADAALAGVDGLTRVLVRPPAILGPGETSIWNTLRPAALREDAGTRRANPDGTFAWVHVEDLAAFLADVAIGAIGSSSDPVSGPMEGGCTPVNIAAARATARDYYGTVCSALGVEPTWTDEPAWMGRIVADRAQEWGWRPGVDLDSALAELAAGLSR